MCILSLDHQGHLKNGFIFIPMRPQRCIWKRLADKMSHWEAWATVPQRSDHVSDSVGHTWQPTSVVQHLRGCDVNLSYQHDEIWNHLRVEPTLSRAWWWGLVLIGIIKGGKSCRWCHPQAGDPELYKASLSTALLAPRLLTRGTV